MEHLECLFCRLSNRFASGLFLFCFVFSYSVDLWAESLCSEENEGVGVVLEAIFFSCLLYGLLPHSCITNPDTFKFIVWPQ